MGKHVILTALGPPHMTDFTFLVECPLFFENVLISCHESKAPMSPFGLHHTRPLLLSRSGVISGAHRASLRLDVKRHSI